MEINLLLIKMKYYLHKFENIKISQMYKTGARYDKYN